MSRPDHDPPSVASDEVAEGPVPFTVRRAVAKVGRNDPCHCGSGKKYKRCCLDKDRERLADPSPYAGLTMEEAKRDPSRHGDPAIFFEMTEGELDAVPRAPLSVELLRGLLAAYRERGALASAGVVLAELASRFPAGEEASEVGAERDALVYEALRRGDRKRARAEIAPRRGPVTFEAQLNQLTLDVQNRPPEKLVRIESYLRQLIDDPRDLVELADALSLGGYPGLTLAISRAAAVLGGSADDRAVLEDLLYSEREVLRLPERDPALRLLAASGPARPRPARRSEEELAELRARLTERESAIQKARSERDRLAGELDKHQLAAAAAAASAPASPGALGDEEARRLKRKVEELQAELTNKQREREELSEKLRAASHAQAEGRGRGAGRGAVDLPPTDEDQADSGEETPDDIAVRPLRFAPAFYESCADLGDGRLALRAQETAVRFASLDPATWKQAKKMQDMKDVYTLRVGIHHRLFVVRSDGALEARELVTREGFDRLLKLRYRR